MEQLRRGICFIGSLMISMIGAFIVSKITGHTPSSYETIVLLAILYSIWFRPTFEEWLKEGEIK